MARYEDYLDLPAAVLDDARLLMEAEQHRDQKQGKRDQRANRQQGSRARVGRHGKHR